ncbi:hypothetical protein V1514DRAFT_328822 [Lipomyces japonicus]|uniref:uncharacterized protein n=1 Tax=Lipomyces japonicus TaxID=56871 RepID=UPI0034CE9A7B
MFHAAPIVLCRRALVSSSGRLTTAPTMASQRHASTGRRLQDISANPFQRKIKKESSNVHPTKPARTRFAPSPTGFVHLGSLRTALYNYLLAKSTGGQFLLRLEDTDRSRLKPGAEDDIYESLRWAGIEWDEGPTNGGPVGPYRQSDRLGIYRQHAQQLIDSGHAYRCFCSKHRLEQLRSTAATLNPPSMATYDRFCYHVGKQESDSRASQGVPHTIRLISPDKYPGFTDLLHGKLDLQVQVNVKDMRYDDPVLFKTDGFPTYHLANVVDDHLMKITHVIRGEEWLPSTPKHVAIYNAFGWTPPEFVHIPLLTTLGDKKLSKRSGDIGIASYRNAGIFPQALINFVALFGWSPPATSTANNNNNTGEIFSLTDLIEKFNLNGLTKGNAKVSEQKLEYFNSYYLKSTIESEQGLDDVSKQAQLLLSQAFADSVLTTHPERFEIAFVQQIVKLFASKIYSINELPEAAAYIYNDLPDYDGLDGVKYRDQLSINDREASIQVIEQFKEWWNQGVDHEVRTSEQIDAYIKSQGKVFKSPLIFKALRFVISGSIPGAPLPKLITILDKNVVTNRCTEAVKHLST